MGRNPRPQHFLVVGLRRLVETIDMANEPYFPGLEGVIAGETAISSIEGELRYRGYSVSELAGSATFLEVAYLLLHGELPTSETLADFQSVLSEAAELPDPVRTLLEEIPVHVDSMDVLRTGVSALAQFDPQCDEEGRDADLNKATRLLAQIPLIVAARYRMMQGYPPVESKPELGFAANLLWMLTGKEPSLLHERAMDVSLILYAEHEFNASTFAARVVTSTGSDMYSAITAAIGALKGPLHGGANERVLEVLKEVQKMGDAEAWVREALAKKRRIMGFGHRVYKNGDPRAVILRGYCRELAEESGDMEMEEIADTIERIVRTEKGLPPNLDWPSARLYHAMGLEPEVFTPLFVVSRVVGWAAHVLEQSESNRLIRPRSRYNGPAKRKFVPLAQRD